MSADDFYLDFGRTTLGPVIVEFMRWVCERSGDRPLFGILREGRILTEVANVLSGRPNRAGELWLSRVACLKAALTGFDDLEALQNFLFRARRRPLLQAEFMQDFNLADVNNAACPLAPSECFTAANFESALRWLKQPPVAERIFAVAARQRRNLLTYLRQSGAFAADELCFTDLGYAANTQHALQKIFNFENIKILTCGYYLVATAGIRYARHSGCVVEGFLADAGLPADFTAAYARTTELLEACLTTPQAGSLLSYDDDGAPVCASSSCPAWQTNAVSAMQQGLLQMAASQQNAARHTRDDLRAGITALLAAPTVEQVRKLGCLHYDENFGSPVTRTLTSTDPAEPADLRSDSNDSVRRRVIWPAAAGLMETGA